MRQTVEDQASRDPGVRCFGAACQARLGIGLQCWSVRRVKEEEMLRERATSTGATEPAGVGYVASETQRQEQNGKLLIAAMQCANTVVLANVLEAMPKSSCLLASNIWSSALSTRR